MSCIMCGREQGRCKCTRPLFVRERDPYAEAAAQAGRDPAIRALASELRWIENRRNRPLRAVR